jgi:hypothetical protein
MVFIWNIQANKEHLAPKDIFIQQKDVPLNQVRWKQLEMEREKGDKMMIL